MRFALGNMPSAMFQFFRCAMRGGGTKLPQGGFNTSKVVVREVALLRSMLISVHLGVSTYCMFAHLGFYARAPQVRHVVAHYVAC